MSNPPEVSIRKEALRITLGQGHQIHLLRLHAPALTLHAQLLVLPGLGDDSAVWLSGEKPWVQAMAEAGWDVYIADTRGKGYSLPKTSPKSDWGFHALLEEEIPALVKRMRVYNTVLPWVCVAGDVIGLGLLAGLAGRRVDDKHLQGLVLLQVGRLDARDWRYQWLWGAGRWVTCMSGYVRAPWLPGPSAESRKRFFESLDWLRMPEWCDVDGANLNQLIQHVNLPGILHIAQRSHWLPAASVQRFVRCLPLHNARLLYCETSDVDAWRDGTDDAIAGFVGEWASVMVQAAPAEAQAHNGVLP